MNTFIVLPTYNEKNNIREIISQIFDLSIPDLNILVVDDNSPDGTGQLVDQLRQTEPRIHVLHRAKKEGLGPAYLAGFAYALEQGADYIMEMDSDGSHHPKYIPAMREAAKSFDLVLGSRYVKGGGVSNWAWSRRLISKFGNYYARLILNSPIKDMTGGFKCFNRRVLEELDLANVESLGYNFQIELTYKALKKGFTIKEIPIVFTERKGGTSKFNPGIVLESFVKVFQLRFKK
ncbi:polyprenol monophosphomannose synthase [Patescibacteria group bacterium]|nr:polyprenol monophosphomannose synthase [Patescibacteria group bacterium]